MRPRRCVAAIVPALLALAAPAAASPVTVVADGHAVVRDDPFLPSVAAPAATSTAPARSRATAHAAQAAGASYRAGLARLRDEHRIDDVTYTLAVEGLDGTLTAAGRLAGTRRAELLGALANLDDIAARGSLTGARVGPLATILDRNRLFWTSSAPLPVAGDRITFKGSRVIYQYFPGEGIQFHPLANFGRAGALANDPRYSANARAFLDELRGFAVPRPGAGIAWEYYFDYGGGRPPWVSGLAQASAVQAYARSSVSSGRADFAALARAGLGVFEAVPPAGVRVATARGNHYLIYSFAPRTRVLNAFVYAVVGLRDVATLLGDARARTLFAAGDAEARVEVPRYDTGAWSLYDGVTESDLGYHRLLQGFLTELCRRVPVAVYCGTATRFARYETIKPVIRLLTRHLAAGLPQTLRLRLSKVSNVTVTGRRGRAVVFRWSGKLAHGTPTLAIRPSRKGRIDFTLDATDLAGNRATASGAITVP